MNALMILALGHAAVAICHQFVQSHGLHVWMFRPVDALDLKKAALSGAAFFSSCGGADQPYGLLKIPVHVHRSQPLIRPIDSSFRMT